MFKKYLIYILLILTVGCATKNYPLIYVPSVQPQARSLGNIDVALVLGGGGAKGIAHLGVLEVLEKHNIPINLIVGTSAGSAIGALYADNPNSQNIKDKLFKLKKWDLLDPSVLDTLRVFTSVKGPIRGHAYQKFIFDNLENQYFESLEIPFIAVTTDIEKNEEYLISSGPIAPAVNASSAIPPFFTPVKMYNRLLVDGGVTSAVPVAAAKRFNPKLTIAVDISAPPARDPITNMGWLTYRSIGIFYYELSRMQSKLADIDIHPDMDGFGIFDDDKSESLYNEGKKAAELAIPEIIKLLAEKKIPYKAPIN